MNIRQATRADNAALRALEARTPLNIGDTPIFIERDNFFETHELQERSVVMLAEEGNEVIGVCAGALHNAPLDGKARLLLYVHHERIAPEHQRKGIGGALTSAISEHWKASGVEHIDSSYWYIAAGNQQSRNFAERSGNRPWPARVYMSTILPAESPGAAPKQIGAGPIFEIVRLINATHAGEELFRAYEQVDFGQRLARSVDYGWGDIFGRFDGDRLVAVAGLWKRTLADYGYEPGGEAHMAALLRQLAGRVATPGHEGLTTFVNPNSSLGTQLGLSSGFVLEILFYTPRLKAPQDPSRRIYVDPVYF